MQQKSQEKLDFFTICKCIFKKDLCSFTFEIGFVWVCIGFVLY